MSEGDSNQTEVTSGQNEIVESSMDQPSERNDRIQTYGPNEMEMDTPAFPDTTPMSNSYLDNFVSQQSEQRQNFQCPMCKFSTRYKTNLTTHMRRHLGDAGRIYKCPHCPYSTASNSDLNRHKKIRHLAQEDTANNFRCGLCSFTSAFQSNLRKHFLKKHVRRPTAKPTQRYEPVLPVALRCIDPSAMESSALYKSLKMNFRSVPDHNVSASNRSSIDPASNMSAVVVKTEPEDCRSTLAPYSETAGPSIGDISQLDDSIDVDSLSSCTPSSPQEERMTPDVLRNYSTAPVFPGSTVDFSASGGTPSPVPNTSGRMNSAQNLTATDNLSDMRNQHYAQSAPTSPVHSLLGKLRSKCNKNYNYNYRISRIALNSDGQSRTSSSELVQTSPSTAASPGQLYACNHCSIYFADCAMYLMHRSLHNMEDPLKCNLCGHQASDKYDFVAHYVNHR